MNTTADHQAPSMNLVNLVDCVFDLMKMTRLVAVTVLVEVLLHCAADVATPPTRNMMSALARDLSYYLNCFGVIQ
jgi:hypothetical protein